MNKSEIIQRICELDPNAKLGLLVNFREEDLQYHLRSLQSESERRSAIAPAPVPARAFRRPKGALTAAH
jgi:hypothetical protein